MTYMITILIYLIALFVVGLVLSRRVKNKDDFMVAGRKLTAPVLVGTLLATWIGSGDVFSVADLSYHHGYSSLIGSAGGWVGIIVVYFIAGRVRRFAQFTVPDILEARYNKWARLLATITTIIAYITIVSYQFRGGGWVIHIITEGDISISAGMMATAAFVILYTLTAGMLSVAYLDVVNGLMIIAGVFIALPFLIQSGGGLDVIRSQLPDRAHWFWGNMTVLQALGYFVPTLLLALGNANMYQRFFSAKNEKEAQKAVIGWVIGVIFLGLGIQSLAVLGSGIFRNLPETESGKIILLAAHQGLPVAVGCLLIASVTAIIISTANSFLLVPSTNVMRDVVQRFIHPNISDKGILTGSRITLVVLGLCAYGLIDFFPRILNAAFAAYTIYGAGLTPAILAAFFWKRATAWGGVMSIALGMAVTIGWEIAARVSGQLLWGIPAVYPALLASVAGLIVVSLLGAKPDSEKWEPFFSEKS